MVTRVKSTAFIGTVIGIAALAAGILFAVTRRPTPPDWEVVGRFHKLYHDVYASEHGFLYRHRFDLYIMCDWQGRERWRVTVTAKPAERLESLVLSPSGHFFATAHAAKTDHLITTYRDGKMVASTVIPTSAPFTRMQVFDNGRVLLVLDARLYLIAGATILAEHKYPQGEGVAVSPDGTVLIAPYADTRRHAPANYVYAKCRLSHGRFVPETTLRLTVQRQHPNQWILSRDGTAIFCDGTVITPTHRVIRNDGWSTITHAFTRHTAGDYLIQYSGDPVTAYRFYNPMTLDWWQIPSSNASTHVNPLDLSRDGQTVFVRSGSDDNTLKVARDGYLEEPGVAYLVYHRHRGIMARMTVNRMNRLLGKEQGIADAYLSPDGRMLLVDTW
ncbi:MAG TPA: hypothetical protein PLZ36_10370, partial [Armatimonadota bacterium]|nr:hypothetical protein [Armatimonadota bacterium]